MCNSEKSPLILREIILNTRKPLVLKQNFLNWPCFQEGLEEWCKNFDAASSSPVNFERISKQNAVEPQWERRRQTIQMTAVEFLKEHSQECEYWSGLNYKRRHELPAKCTNGIDLSGFGFPQAADDSTLWLSSNGANTPCHYDSYGCNIVVQVFGRKSWLLFPPNTPLTSTRIPYEESSIYCKENFYSPCLDFKKYLEKFKDYAHHITLEPSDVLIVPKHWWHYVESRDISLSVNAWIPLESDLEQQIEECIVKYLMEKFTKDCTFEIRKYILNPNQLMDSTTNEELFNILKFLLDKSNTTELSPKKETNIYNYHYLPENDVETLLQEIQNCERIAPMTTLQFENFLKSNSLRYKPDVVSDYPKDSLDFMEEILINSICSPRVIESIKKEFCKRFCNRKN